MQSRRQVLKGTAAGLALPALAAAAPAAARPLAASGIDLAVFDARFPVAKAVAAALSRRGARTFAVDGDVTSFWYNQLDRQWRERDVRLAGVTTEQALFVLEQLAWHQRYRVLVSMPLVESADAAGVVDSLWTREQDGPHPAPMQPALFGAGQRLVAWSIGPVRLGRAA